MDKYQLNAFKCFKFGLYSEDQKGVEGASAKLENGELILKQGDDITITKYTLAMEEFSGKFVKLKISFYIGNKWVTPTEIFRTWDSTRVLSVDFKKPFNKAKIEQVDGLIEPFEFPVKFVNADVDAYNKRVAEAKAKEDAEKQAQIDKMIKADYKVGDNLVNLYWNLVNDKVKKTKVELYLADGFDFNRYQVNKEVVDESTGKKVNKWVTETKITKTGNYRKVASYEIEDGITFKSISGLAFGTYAFEITELDAKGNKIASTGKVLFKLTRPGSGASFASNAR